MWVFCSSFGQVVFGLFIFIGSLGSGFGRYSKDNNQGSDVWCFAYGHGSAGRELRSLSPDSIPVPFSLSPRPERHHVCCSKRLSFYLYLTMIRTSMGCEWDCPWGDSSLGPQHGARPRAGIRNPSLNNVYHWVPGFGVHCGRWLQEVLIGYGNLLVHWGSSGGPIAILPRCSSLFHHRKSPRESILPHHKKGFCE